MHPKWFCINRKIFDAAAKLKEGHAFETIIFNEHLNLEMNKFLKQMFFFILVVTWQPNF
jgi:hypothetical protein